MSSVGLGVSEIRIREDDGAFRVIYVAKFAEAVYALHAFQKKARKTPKADIDLALAGVNYLDLLASTILSGAIGH